MSADSGKTPVQVPVHIGIIMDGNGRWARERGLHRNAGHYAGTENIRRILTASAEHGVKVLTIYAFSTENWGRPQEEIEGLMAILGDFLRREVDELHRNGVHLRHSGLLDGVAESLQRQIRDALELTQRNDRITLNVAFNYGGRAEIVRAIRRLMADGVSPDAVSEATVSRYLDTAGLPDPDLIIRTGGEMRLSNFLIWQASYAEYYASPKYWPDFDEDDLRLALQAYAQRHRRFGLVQEPAL